MAGVLGSRSSNGCNCTTITAHESSGFKVESKPLALYNSSDFKSCGGSTTATTCNHVVRAGISENACLPDAGLLGQRSWEAYTCKARASMQGSFAPQEVSNLHT